MSRSREQRLALRIDALDVRLLDLLAEVEAMLRGARLVQRTIIELRGWAGGARPRANHSALLRRIHESLAGMGRELQVIVGLMDALTEAETTLRAAANDTKRHRR